MTAEGLFDEPLPGARVVRRDLLFPESPRWRDGLLWFSDFGLQAVLAVRPSGELVRRTDLDDAPSGLGFLPSGTVVAAAMQSRRLVALSAGGPATVADLAGLGGDFLNDMAVTAAGLAYVGVRRRYPPDTAAELRDEALALVSPGGEVRIVAEGLAGPNGCILDPDGHLLVAETQGHRISAFRMGEEGELHSRRVLFETEGVFPDGICLDASGAVWVASPYTGEFVRYAADGRVLRRISVSPWGAVACVLGGAERRTLFLVLARLPAGGLAAALAAGRAAAATPAARVAHLRTLGMDGMIVALPADVAGVGFP